MTQPMALSTAAARTLTTTTKSVPQMASSTSRWLLRVLPWVEAVGGAYRVNRRLSYAIGDGRLTFLTEAGQTRVVPQELRELPVLRDFADDAVLGALAERFAPRQYAPGDVIVASGQPADTLFLLAYGKAHRLGTAKYGDETVLGVLAEGDYFGEQALTEEPGRWTFTVRAVTPCTVLVLRAPLDGLNGHSEPLRAHITRVLTDAARPRNKVGEAEIALASGHAGEPVLPATYVDYELAPREYELSVAQTVLRVHSRVADLFNQPMNQVEQQLRLTIEALRERQEHEMVNNRDFGLLHNADLRQRIHTRTGPPTPDDLDELLCRRRKSRYFLAHPRAIAAFGRECNRRGLYPATVEVAGRAVAAWRGVPLLPCDKIPITAHGTTSILVFRTGEDDEGVIGLRQTGIPDEYQPGLSVRLMSVNPQAITAYLVSAYYSVAVLVPDALGVLDSVEIGR